MNKIINVTIFEPHNALFKEQRNDKSECKTVSCSNSDNCSLYKNGKCVLINTFGSGCPYGIKSREVGPTKRASKYGRWISERKEKYKEVYKKLGSNDSIMAVVGDYIFLPYAHMGLEKDIPFVTKSGLFGGTGGFLKLVDFTPNMIHKLVSIIPMSLLGGPITSYETEVVPIFLKHLSEVMPEKFNEFVEAYPQYEKYRNSTNVGRKAMLSSIKVGVGLFKDIHGGLWSWDGTYLISTNSKMSFGLVNKFEEIRVKPLGDHEVKISDDGQVSKNTKFLD